MKFLADMGISCTFKRSFWGREGLVILRELSSDRRISSSPAFSPHSERSFGSAQDDFIAKGIA